MAIFVCISLCWITLQVMPAAVNGQSYEHVYVETKNGIVFGEKTHFIREEDPVVNTTLDIFKGIPFAVPPLGEWRFRKPVPVPDWSAEWNATFYRKQCWQLLLENFTLPQDEDCLYLNIWSPDVKVSKVSMYATEM